MKKTIAFFIIIFSFQNLSAQNNEEFRGVWLTNVDSYVLNTDKNIADAMDYLSSIGINVVFPVVYNKGYTLYPSAIMDSLFGQPTIPDNSFSSRDFLKRLVIEAHRNGIEVIPWFEFGFSSSYSQNGGHIVAEFPSWALKNVNGQLVVKNGFDWLSGINPEVQNYMLGLLMEVIRNYDVDGVQGDDRLPAMPVEGGYDSATVAIYKSEHNGTAPPANITNPDWMKWRADKLTEYLERVRDSVKTADGNLILSVSPTPFYWGYGQYLQDSENWAQKNLLDNIIPQLYQYNISNYNFALSTTWNDVGQYDPNDFFAGVLAKVGSYVVGIDLLEDMLQANRTKGIKGECFFFYEALRANNNEIGDFLGQNFYMENAVPPYRSGNIWRPKGKIINEDSSASDVVGNWEIYSMPGYEGAILRTNNLSSSASITYNFLIEDAAYYDVFIYKTPNFTWSKQAQYTIYSAADSEKVLIDQSNLNEKGWYKIGTAYLDAGNQAVVKVDNSQLENGKYLVSDAVMLMINRKLSPDVVVGVEDSQALLDPSLEYLLLEQNYPNPFNPSTKINYSISEGGFVSLKVFDILGREVAVLVNEEKNPGEYKAEFSLQGNGNLSSGIYFYKLTVSPGKNQSGSYSQTKKMILLK